MKMTPRQKLNTAGVCLFLIVIVLPVLAYFTITTGGIFNLAVMFWLSLLIGSIFNDWVFLRIWEKYSAGPKLSTYYLDLAEKVIFAKFFVIAAFIVSIAAFFTATWLSYKLIYPFIITQIIILVVQLGLDILSTSLMWTRPRPSHSNEWFSQSN